MPGSERPTNAAARRSPESSAFRPGEVQVLSPGSANERCDREVKLKLYSRRGVLEYWIVDWQQRKVEVFRRQEQALHLVATLYATDTLTSPMLPGFACLVTQLFVHIPPLS